MGKFSLVIVFVLCAFIAKVGVAQNFEGMIQKGQSEKALLSLNTALLKAPNDIRLNFYKARTYAATQGSIYNVDSAYYCYDKCLKLFGILKDIGIREKLYKEFITPTVIKNQINNLLTLAFDAVQKSNTLEGYESFIARFPEARQASQAQTLYDALFLKNKLPTLQSAQDYRNFIITNPKTRSRLIIADSMYRWILRKPIIEDMKFFVQQFPDHEMYVDVMDRLYQIYRKDGEYLSLQRFYKLSGSLPFSDQQIRDVAWAKMAWKMGLTASNSNSQGGCFGNTKSLDTDNEELNRRLTREGAQTGDLQFSLMWNNYNDLDLHVTDPNGQEIYYRDRTSYSGGLLDVDMNVHYKTGRYSNAPVENIFWAFGTAPAGHYRVTVVHYLNHAMDGCKDPTPFTVRVRCNGQDTLIKSTISYNGSRVGQKIIAFDYSVPMQFTPEMNDSLRIQFDKYIRSVAPLELAWVAVLKLMADPLRAHDWTTAAKLLSGYARYFVSDNNIMNRIRETDQMLNGNLYAITKEKLTQVNTAGEEYSPVPGADEQTLYFCGRDRSGNLGKEDIFISRLKGNSWSAPTLLENINTATENEAPLSVSVDGNTLLLFRSGDIYFVTKTLNGWSSPSAFPAPVNTEFWEGDAMLTADGRALIFSSNRPGGKNLHVEQNYFHGNTNYASDIYICVKTATGWGPAINLGSSVNTPYCERSPLLHPDLKTLYFSSDGHYGLGDLDVFMIRRSSDTSWTQWSKPVNLGKYINTPDADWGYRVSSSGQWAYFSAVDVEAGTKEDIYRFQLPAELRPEPVIALTGQLTDDQGRNVSALIHWIDLTTGEETGVATSDPRTGMYFILLPSGGNYGYYADSGSYFSVSNQLDLTTDRNYHTVTQDIDLYRVDDLVASGTPLRINNLFFDYDKSSLRQESYPELKRMAGIISNHPGLKIEIMGHTDDAGPDDYNLTLSESRAKSVMDYLISKGVDAAALQAKGYGETKPMLPNTSDKNRQMNRRVEFRFFR